MKHRHVMMNGSRLSLRSAGMTVESLKDERMALFEIKNLHVEIDGKKILNGLDLVVEKGSVHAIMGPNGSGKSTLAYVLAGKDDYVVTDGRVLFDGADVLAVPPDERAAKGLF